MQWLLSRKSSARNAENLSRHGLSALDVAHAVPGARKTI
jgi:hypothetical protein